MLRRICNFRRGPNEDWLDWVKRATRKARNVAQQAGMRDWVQAHAAQKWSWAGHVSRRDSITWLSKVSMWRDSNWNIAVSSLGCDRPRRPSRRRWMKWEDVLRRFCTEHSLGAWTQLASDKQNLMHWQSRFATWFSGVSLQADCDFEPKHGSVSDQAPAAIFSSLCAS